MLDWIEQHDTFIGILFKVFCGIVGFIIAGILYYFKFYREQRGKALFGFYLHYEMLLSILYTQLIGCKEKNNPYVLMYNEDARGRLSLLLPGGTEQKTIEMFTPVAKEIKTLLLNTENVYPQAKSKKEWYDNTKIILGFALMITDRLNVGAIGYSDNSTVYKEKLDALKNAITNLQNVISKIKK